MNDMVFWLFGFGLGGLIVGIICDFYLVLVLSVSKLEPKSIRKLEGINLLVYFVSTIIILVAVCML